METGLTKNQIVAQLSRSPHGKLSEYLNVGREAALKHPEFLAHLIAWDRQKGQIRDAKVALPVVSLTLPSLHPEFVDNAMAHLAMLGPRELLKAFRFALEVRPQGHMGELRRLVEQYLRDEEADKRGWDKLAVQHRNTLKELYSLAHVKPSGHADAILFKNQRPAGSVFEVIANLGKMSPTEAAGEIAGRKIPFLIAMGALGEKAKDPELVLALINRMTPTEVVTNTKMLEKLGARTNPALRGAFESALERASKSSVNLFKTTRAAEAVEDEDLKEKLRGLQEKQIAAHSGVEGNWLVLADKSGSMAKAIEVSKHVAGTLAKMVKGKVWLVFFDNTPMTIDVTGLALDQIQKATRHVIAGGGTSIGCGLQRMLEANEEIDGIVVVSDANENSMPRFANVYQQYAKKFDKQVPVYLYRVDGSRGWQDKDLAESMKDAQLDLQEFDLRGSNIDYYSVANTVATMRTNRYSLVDEIMATPLKTLTQVFKASRKEELAQHA